ncbi:ABC transporter substrate-binding protein [Oerskovia sp. KBS0722]|uniref:ABC transporter substrate-binding protein n=1 Tax=Oerskovia sp. KBS0722 TaxID=1179673 RepID=UPI001AF0046D|nr:ABC transporter substrate-binding protein [Oerskovia sp. KBS0722]
MTAPLSTSPQDAPQRAPHRRRTTAAWAVAVGASLLLAACSSGSDAADTPGGTDETAGTAGAWSYTDARGETVSLDEVPDRIIATADTAPVLLEYGIRPVGIIGFSRLSEEALASFDFEGIEHISETDTDISLEKVLAADADLVLDIWSSYNGGNFGSIWGDDIERVESVVPMVGVNITDGAASTLADFQEVVLSLGGSETSPVYAQESAELAELSEKVKTLAATKTDVAVAYAIPLETSIDYAVPTWTPLGSTLVDLGVTFAELDSEDGFWASASWEEPGAYPADLILVPSTWADATQLETPTFTALPAVTSGQLAQVELRTGYSLTGITSQLEAFLAAYEPATHVTG